ncbi:MAG: hypothetical protein L0387_14045 [Acidobacteria bacterium]|nr:hypothetical protein [Acidobacteriota bacterium]MCI0721964.1 hypothetical protein [Acidobacteriota bacterium]
MKNCNHSGCHCKVTPGKGVSENGKIYCSQYCANARETSGTCRCGHASCESK